MVPAGQRRGFRGLKKNVAGRSGLQPGLRAMSRLVRTAFSSWWKGFPGGFPIQRVEWLGGRKGSVRAGLERLGRDGLQGFEDALTGGASHFCSPGRLVFWVSFRDKDGQRLEKGCLRPGRLRLAAKRKRRLRPGRRRAKPNLPWTRRMSLSAPAQEGEGRAVQGRVRGDAGHEGRAGVRFGDLLTEFEQEFGVVDAHGADFGAGPAGGAGVGLVRGVFRGGRFGL